MGFKQRIEDNAMTQAIGLEVHVEGWGDGPFFTVHGFDKKQDLVLLSTRYSRAIKYRVPRKRAYFTARCRKTYMQRVNAEQKEV